MITVFTIPKPFRGAVATAQLNALRSWRALGPDVELVVVGDEDGASTAAAEVAAVHVPAIGRTELGTPLVSEAFAAVAGLARHETLCYANADMLLLGDVLTAVRRVRDRRALLIGRRVDLDVEGELDFGPGWEARLLRAAATRGRLGTERQIDYMVFPRDVRWEMPPFAVGRPGWDNWLLYRARRLGLAIVDVTPVVLAVHQTHGYEHVPSRQGSRWRGPEAERNWTLSAEMGPHAYGILDATHVLTARRLLPALGPRHLKRRARRHRLLGRGVGAVDELLGR